MIKTKAKQALKNYYWMAVLAALIMTLLQGNFFNNSSNNTNNFFSEYLPQHGNGSSYYLDKILNSTTAFTGLLFAITSISILFLVVIGGLIFSALVTNVVKVGYRSYFIKSNRENTGIGELFAFFRGDTYKNTVVTMVLKDIFIFLWSLLLIIPGIIKSYEYYFVEYIIAENPQLDWREAMQLSKRMTDDRKGELFIFDISFILWNILAAFVPFKAGGLFLSPYVQASRAELYETLKPSVTVESNDYF